MLSRPGQGFHFSGGHRGMGLTVATAMFSALADWLIYTGAGGEGQDLA